MPIKVLAGFDLALTELLNALAHKIAGNPGSPTEGQIWYDTTAKKFKFRSDTANIDPTARAEHTGTQLAATISDFNTAVRTNRLDQMAVPTADVSFGSVKITNLASPVGAADATPKSYVDSLVNGLDWKASVRAATTANIALTGTQTIDGVALVAGDRVLVKNQTAGAENGIYVVAAGAWARSADADVSAEVTTGLATFVEEGTAVGNQQWSLTTDGPITLGTTALVFAQIGAPGGSPAAGLGLTLVSNTYDVVAGNGILSLTDSVTVDPAVVTRHATGSLTGGATSEVLTHNLNTRLVKVSIRNNASPWDEVMVTDEATTVNTVTIRAAANLPAGYTWVVMG